MEAATDIWTELENPPKEFEGIAELYHWSLNYDAGHGPFTLLLDIVGWSDEQIGENLYAGSMPIGYLEAAKLAKALTEWADHGSSGYAYIEKLMALEG